MSIRVSALVFGACVVLAASDASAQSLPSSTSGTPTPLTDAQALALADQMIPVLDQNHDGRLSKAEVVAFDMRSGRSFFNERRWKQADVDHDGFLSRTEVAGVLKRVSVEQARAAEGPSTHRRR